MGYDALRKAVKLVDQSYVSRDFKETHDLGKGPGGGHLSGPTATWAMG